MSLTTKILLGFVAGVLAGIVAGEPLGELAILGDVFVRLLQMTVLPYVVVSLISGFGHLDPGQARRLGLWGGSLLVLLWALTFLAVAVMPLAFPALVSASFYSTTLVDPPPELDFLHLYIPSNPFDSLAHSVVPAVVVFSVALGIALISQPDRRPLLQALDTIGEALLKVNGFVVRLTPAGVFFIAASTAGTMSIDEFQRVQVFLISYILFALVATFWLLPGLLEALTPIRRKDASRLIRDALITAFATANSFVVIPLVAEASKQLLEPHVSDREDAESFVDILVPASHTFPHSAKILTLSFILFAGWFNDDPVKLTDYPVLLFSGIASLFGSVNGAIPFLLDLMRLPQDLFRLFLATSVLNSHFGTLLQTMHVLVLTVLTTAAIGGGLRFRWKPVLRYVVVTASILGAAVLGTRALYTFVVDTSYRKDQILTSMNMRLAREQVTVVVHREPPPIRGGDEDPTRSRLETILERGALRVCYRPDGAVPFSYFNRHGDLVGLDVEMAHSLARGLDVSLEFVPVASQVGTQDFAEALDSGYCDIVMSRSAISMAALSEIAYSRPYLDLNLGFLVRDHRLREFTDRDALERWEGLRIAVPGDPYYLRRVRQLFPAAEVVALEDVREFLDDSEDRFDALAFFAEAAATWSLLNPSFNVVVPEPSLQRIPLAYVLPRDDVVWQRAVDAWLELKRSDGTVDALYDYWILGREAEPREPRWSLLRDVLGWID